MSGNLHKVITKLLIEFLAAVVLLIAFIHGMAAWDRFMADQTEVELIARKQLKQIIPGQSVPAAELLHKNEGWLCAIDVYGPPITEESAAASTINEYRSKHHIEIGNAQFGLAYTNGADVQVAIYTRNTDLMLLDIKHAKNAQISEGLAPAECLDVSEARLAKTNDGQLFLGKTRQTDESSF